MDQRTIKLFFALLRSAICGTKLTAEEKNIFSSDMLENLLNLAIKHDIAHLLVFGLKQNDLISKEKSYIEEEIFKAVYRSEKIKYDFNILCNALEKAEIPFIPLKGSVIRKYYPKDWMRTSCDIDVLVHQEDLEKAIYYLESNHSYTIKKRGFYDVSLYTQNGTHIEIHFNLMANGIANNAIDILSSVWDNVLLCNNTKFCYKMTDSFFYFFHIAHMAKHFKGGGCGIRPLIDLWILDNIKNVDKDKRDVILSIGDLLEFANIARRLSKVWFEGIEGDKFTCQMEDFLLRGGVYGSTDNRVALEQKSHGGRFGYIFYRIFAPYEILKYDYPIIKKHRWLIPFAQIKRWFKLLDPKIAKTVKRELSVNKSLEKSKAEEMKEFLDNLGLK